MSRLDRLVAKTPLNAAFRHRTASALTVVAYHGVDEPDTFAQHLDHLRRRYRPVTLDEVAQFVTRREVPPPGSVLITFDDGHRSVLDVALPLLRERGLPGMAFVVTGLLDSDDPFWWDEVGELLASGGRAEQLASVTAPEVVRELKRVPDATRLAVIADLRATATRPAGRGRHLRSADLRTLESAGVAIGSHTVTHPMLPACPLDKVQDELERSRARLAEILGRPPRAFAYPSGAADERVAALARDVGYELAFLFDHRANPMPIIDPMNISRVRVNSTTSMDRFEAILSGLHPWVHHRVMRRG